MNFRFSKRAIPIEDASCGFYSHTPNISHTLAPYTNSLNFYTVVNYKHAYIHVCVGFVVMGTVPKSQKRVSGSQEL